LAQVNREDRTSQAEESGEDGLVIFIYSLLFTSLVSFFAVMIIPDKVRPDYFANLIGGIAMYLAGPESLKLLFHAFVVLVGVLILAGAQNTSIVGANGVLKSRGGRRSAHQLVPEAAQPLRDELPHHQLDRGAPTAHDRIEPGKRVCVGRALRFWRDLELRHEVHRRAGAALYRTGESGRGKCREICTLAKPSFRWD